MKTRRKIASSLNLIIFISSLLFSAFSSFGSDQQGSALNHNQYHFVSKHAVGNGDCSQLIFEENENEKNENAFHSPVFFLPFFTSILQLEISECFHIPATLTVVRQTKPIYLAVCNFRV